MDKYLVDRLVDSVKSMIEVEGTFMTAEEASLFLQIKKSTLYKMTHKKLIPFSKPGGKVLRFKKADLIAWMNSNPVKTEALIDEQAANYLINK